MQKLVTLSLLAATASTTVQAATMDCGSGVSLCGVLCLETGYGPNEYASKEPAVHGLWPENAPYGNSECIAPTSTTNPTSLATCYQNGTQDVSSQLSFEIHEWEKHGSCSGVKDADDFFTQVCGMAEDPLAVMSKSKDSGGDLDAIANAVADAGYDIFFVDTQNSQLYLSACASPDRVWKLAKPSDFPSVCGGWSDSDDNTPTPDPASSCPANAHGPACTSDKDCSGITDCVRCASSGFCTATALTKR
jgi:hypothetical protein